MHLKTAEFYVSSMNCALGESLRTGERKMRMLQYRRRRRSFGMQIWSHRRILQPCMTSRSSITQETLDIPPPCKYNTAYAKSKWLAEQIVRHGVTDLRIRARIYRLGTMSCHSNTGVSNRNDTFTRIVDLLLVGKGYEIDI